MSNATFFHDLPAMQSLNQIADVENYSDIPSDWLIAITDVVGSTKAIEAGRYKAVNTVAAVTITAILNSIPNIDVPFVFGGDGASVVVPPEVTDEVHEALGAIKRIGRVQFQLDVRAGVVPVSDVVKAGYRVMAGKVEVSENFKQPVFTGGGLDYADHLVKAPETSHLYRVEESATAQVDLNGYECRWSKHSPAHDEVLSLLVKAVAATSEANYQIYRNILMHITDVYGDAQSRHPINYDKMRVSTVPAQFINELGWKQEIVSFWDKLQLMFWAIGGFLLWKYVDKTWDKYKTTVRDATDHEKFDDMLRMTISGTVAQRHELLRHLEDLHQMGQIAYGTHTANYSLMTCIVFDRFGRQVHFVDADAGGYAMAAKQLKRQLKTFTSEPSDAQVPESA